MTLTFSVSGLGEVRRGFKSVDTVAARDTALRNMAKAVEADARRRVPVLTGAARASVHIRPSGNVVEIIAGGGRVPYFGWLDFGGRVGIGKSVYRPYLKQGRYIYRALSGVEPDEVAREALEEEMRTAGLEVTRG